MNSKKILMATLCVLVLCILTIVYVMRKSSNPESPLSTPAQLGSYAMGYKLIQEQKAQGVKIDQQALKMGISEALSGKKRFSYDELVNLEAGLRDLVGASASELALANKKIAEEFLAQNKSREGVVALPSGTQYRIIEKSIGITPKKNDWVKIAYEIRLISGELYESSRGHGEWVDIPVTNAFPAMQEALQLMSAGSHWTVYAPPSVAYGSVPRNGLEPNTVLIIDLKLKEITKK